MESDLNHLLQRADKKNLLLLLQELILQHPALQAEIMTILERNVYPEQRHSVNDTNRQDIEEDWNFSGDEEIEVSPTARPHLPLPDLDMYRQRIAAYGQLIQRKKSHRIIASDLEEILREAQHRIDYDDYINALALYVLVLDARLAEGNAELNSLFDTAIDGALPTLQAALSDVSSQLSFSAGATYTPLLTPEMRTDWLKRLFALWMQWLDSRHTGEDLPELMLDIAWNDDKALLQRLAQDELQRLHQDALSNIVNFSIQYRMRALERFMTLLSPA